MCWKKKLFGKSDYAKVASGAEPQVESQKESKNSSCGATAIIDFSFIWFIFGTALIIIAFIMYNLVMERFTETADLMKDRITEWEKGHAVHKLTLVEKTKEFESKIGAARTDSKALATSKKLDIESNINQMQQQIKSIFQEMDSVLEIYVLETNQFKLKKCKWSRNLGYNNANLMQNVKGSKYYRDGLPQETQRSNNIYVGLPLRTNTRSKRCGGHQQNRTINYEDISIEYESIREAFGYIFEQFHTFWISSHDGGKEFCSLNMHLCTKSIAWVNTAQHLSLDSILRNQEPRVVPWKFIELQDLALPPAYLSAPLKPKNIDFASKDLFVFFSGKSSSRIYCKYTWMNDTRILNDMRWAVYFDQSHAYDEFGLRSVFCLCPHGSRDWSPRLVQAIIYGCIPVIVAKYYFLPFANFLDWTTFSIHVKETCMEKKTDIYTLLNELSQEEIFKMQNNLMKVRHHFILDSNRKFDALDLILMDMWMKNSRNASLGST